MCMAWLRCGFGPRHIFNYAVWMTRIVVVVFALTIPLVLAGPSEAAVVLKFEPRTALPGTTIDVRSVGQSLAGDRFEVLLAPSQRVADEASGAGVMSDPRLVRIGHLAADGPAADRFTFTVPNVEPGKYVAVLHCRGCGSGGASLTALGRFRVTAGSRLAATGPQLGMFAVAAGLLLGAGQVLVGLVYLVRRRAQSTSI